VITSWTMWSSLPTYGYADLCIDAPPSGARRTPAQRPVDFARARWTSAYRRRPGARRRRGRPAGPAHAIPLSGDFTFVTGTNLNGIAATANRRRPLHPRGALPDRSAHGNGDRNRPRRRRRPRRRWHPAARPHALRRPELPQPGDGRLARSAACFRRSDRRHPQRPVPSAQYSALFGSSLYVVNARFDVAFPPFLAGQPMAIDYDVVRVRLPR
jgi:hypothetical protein